jgi:putative oxidoreductase
VIPHSSDLPRQTAAATHSAARAAIGVLFAFRGVAGLFGLFGGVAGTHDGFPLGSWPGWWVAVLQLVGGILVAIGLYTRVTAALSSIAMAYIYFMVHVPHGVLPIQNGGELAMMFTWTFALIAAIGAGPYAVDALIRQRRRSSDIKRYLDTGNIVGISISD